jgi:hypothetical protein
MTHYDATSLPRLMQCGASKSMPGFYVQGDQSDDVREGNAAHWLASEYLNGRISDLDEWIDRKAPNGVYISDAMVDHVRWYVEGVMRDRASDRHYTEQDFIAHNGFPDGPQRISIGCRPDHLSDDMAEYGRRIRIDDFKYGWRLVEVENNWTLIAHACAYIADKVIAPDTIFEFRIWQPRPYHPAGSMRVWIVDAYHLSSLRNQLFHTLALTSDQLQTGWYCLHCPAMTNCPASRKASMTMLDVAERAIPDNMTLDEMSMMMDALTVGDYTLKAYKDALAERITDSLRNGQTVRNYRLKPYEGALAWVEGIDETALRLLVKPGKAVSKPTPLLTPTQLKKAIPELVLKQITYRKPGGLTLERKDTDQLAQEMFGKPAIGDTGQ